MEPGIRVIRGPDWCHGNQDGGPGFLGTVVKFRSNNRVVVIWDIGTVTECRAGSQGAFDLRVYDNAQIGIKQVICDGECLDTDDNNDYGFRWKDLGSEDRDQCTPCYMKDQGELDHAYARYTTRKSLVERVEPRSRSRAVPLVGIFPGAEVERSVVTPAEKGDQTGIVKEMINHQGSYRGAVTVEWKNPVKKPKGHNTEDSEEEPEPSIYRLGANGRVDLRLVAPSPEKRQVYIDHLPVLDLTMPVDIEFRPGDKVRMDLNLDTFRALQREYGGWVEDLENIMGEEGKIEKVLEEPRRLATVSFGDKRVKAVYMNTLTKLQRFGAGDYVRIIDDVARVKKAQAAHGGWQDSLASVLGQVGRINRVDASGDVYLVVQNHTYLFNQECITALKVEEKQMFLRDDPYGSMPAKPPSPTVVRGRVPVEARRTCCPGQSVGVGARVVRGPDWKSDFGNQDGGEGHLGSIVEIAGQKGSDLPDNCVMVQWDIGEKDIYRAGFQNAYDLRIFDNAGIGVKHNAQCSECRAVDICGIIWKCSEYPEVTLCSECYSSDRHDINQHFVRINCPGDQGVQVPKRSMSKKLTAKGIFERCKVKRGPNWRWHNQDGGPDKTGEVIAMVNFSPDTDHDAVEVTWENGYTNVYRLGYNGSLDVQCVNAANGGGYYRDHLPILKLDKNDVQISGPGDESALGAVGGQGRFKEGDKVRIEMELDLLRTIEKERGSWNEMMADCRSDVGIVKLANPEGEITVDFGRFGTWTFSEMSLSKVKEFVPGEIVRVNSNFETVRRIQDETIGWNDLMAKVVGKKGRVEGIDEDGDIQVSFGDLTWTFCEDCLYEDTGEPDDVTYMEKEKKVEEKQEDANEEVKKVNDIFDAIEKADSEAVERLISRNQNLLNQEYQGKKPIHLAIYKGELSIIQTILHGRDSAALTEMKDDEENTPLLAAVKGRQLRVAQMLTERGVDKHTTNKDQQSAVHLAVVNQDVAMLRFLRDNNFDINQKDSMQQSPVFDAILSGNTELTKIILEWPNIDITAEDNLGFRPFFIACRKGDVGVVHQLLLKAPDELNSKKKTDGFTGLHIASLNGKTELVRYLLNQDKIKVDIKTSDGRTPLHIASGEGHIDIVKILMAKGADSKAVDINGRNCLHLCLLVQDEQDKTDEMIIQVAEFLVEKGVSDDFKDSNGKIPVDLASDNVGSRMKLMIEKRNQEIRAREEQQKQSENKRLTGSPFGQLRMANLMTQSMFVGKSQAGVRQPTPPFATQLRFAQTQMSQSMIVSPKHEVQGQIRLTRQYQGNGDISAASGDPKFPKVCLACEEEACQVMLTPCGHAFCKECAPGKKMKRKRCPECAQEAESVIDINI